MDSYRSDIIKALGALNRQHDEMKKAAGKGEGSSKGALEDAKMDSLQTDSALAAVDARCKVKTADCYWLKI